MKNNLSNLGEGRWRLRVCVGRDDGGRIKLLARNEARGRRRSPSWSPTSSAGKLVRATHAA